MDKISGLEPQPLWAGTRPSAGTQGIGVVLVNLQTEQKFVI